MKNIIIITSSSSIYPSHQDLGLLLECAPDNKIFAENKKTFSVQTILGDLEKLREEASLLSVQLLEKEPFFRGIQQLSIFQETIIVELYKILKVVKLYEFLLNENYESCEFLTHSWWINYLQLLVKIKGSSLKIIVPTTPHQSKLRKLMIRLYNSKFSYMAIKDEFLNVLRFLDPFKRHNFLIKKNPSIKKQGIWFYSTGINYTSAGLAYEPLFGEKFNYLVEDKNTGGKPLKNKKRNFNYLYDFAKISFIPNLTEIKKIKQTIINHLLSTQLPNNSKLITEMFLQGTWLTTTFFSKLLPQGLYFSSIFTNWINVVEPSMIVVGNQVCEGYALIIAKHKKIPTILLQHGVMSDYFKYIDYPVDLYLVRGKFFFERLSPISQQKSLIINPSKNDDDTKKLEKKYLLFITMPHFLLPIDIEIESILLTVLKAATQMPLKLMIRVHPLERLSDYKNLVNQLCQSNRINIDVEYSQGEGILQILQSSAMAILFHSTMFLDCIKHNIPIIGFDWHHFSFKNKLKEYGVINFSSSLENLSSILLNNSDNRLQKNKFDYDIFLQQDSLENMQLKIKKFRDTYEIKG